MPAEIKDDIRIQKGFSPIAVVGVGALFPGSSSVDGFWRDILAGRDLITDVPSTHWIADDHYDPDPRAADKTYSKRGAFLSPIEFDPVEFGVPPANLSSTDTAQLLALIVAKQVLEDAARGRFEQMDRDRISVILGVAAGLELLGEMNSRLQRPVWAKALREHDIPEDRVQKICESIAANYSEWKESTFPGLLGNVVAGRIANHFDLGGTNCTTDAACASAFSALSMALNELRLGQSDLVITGGVDATNGPFLYTCFAKTPALSPSDDCRPFSDGADGMLLGEGIGMVALKRLADAERDGDRIYAVLKGLGTSSDGRGASVYAPVPKGQAKALRRCYASSGYRPSTVELVEAHGTGTAAGDAAEFKGLCMAFGEAGRRQGQWCALGSVKSQIGHTKSAAGVAGLIKAVMALHHKVLPPTIKVDRPDPRLDLAHSPFYLNTRTRPWIRDASHPRRASVSSFGFGGTNFHVTAEEYAGPGKRARRLRTFPSELVLLGAADARELATRCRETVAELEGADGLPFLARTGQEGFEAGAAARVAMVADDVPDLKIKLEQAADLIVRNPGTPFSLPAGIHYRSGRVLSGGLAFLYPGQGSEYIGMGADLAIHFDAVREIWDRAAALDTGEPPGLHEIVFPRPVFTREEEMSLAERLASPPWAQPAVSVTGLAMSALLDRLGIHPDAVGGHGLGEATALCEAGVLDFQGLLHVTRRMAAARSPCRDILDDIPFEKPRLPVFSNTEAGPYPHRADRVRQVLCRQIDGPARFEEEIEAMHAGGARIFIEVGPGSALTEMVDRCLDGRPHAAVNVDARGMHGVTALWHALGRLAVEGLDIHWAPVWAPYAPPAEPRREKKPGHCVSILGCNYGKPYPPPMDCNLPTVSGPTPRSKPRKEPLPMKPTPSNQSMPLPAPADPPAPDAAGKAENRRSSPSENDPLSSHGPQPTAAPPARRFHGRNAQWLQAFLEIQRQTAETHAAYQKHMAETHMKFLQSAEAGTRTLRQLMAGDLPMEGRAIPSEMEPVRDDVPLTQPPQVPPWPSEREDRGRDQSLPATESGPPVPLARDPAPPDESAAGAAEPAHPQIDYAELLLRVVAEKTGYPGEILNMEMDLEADLGIDSIKRVEILSAVRDEAQWLPEVDTAAMADIRTLGDVLAYMVQVESEPAVPEPSCAPIIETAGTGTADIGRFILQKVPAPQAGVAMKGLVRARCVVITDDGTGVARALQERLAARDVAARIVEEIPEEADAVLFLGGLRPCADREAAAAVNREAFQAARKAAVRLAGSRGAFITVQDTGGDFGISGRQGIRAWLGGLPGLVKTVALEWPGVSAKAIDIQRGTRSADALAAALDQELFSGGPEIEVGLSEEGRRVRPDTLPVEATPSQYPLDDGSVIVASGGARGITAATLLQVAHAFHPRILLLGRTPLTDEADIHPQAVGDGDLKQALLEAARAAGETLTPAQLGARTQHILAMREIRATLQGLQAFGAQARYLTVDVQDRAALEAALASIRDSWGPIGGIIHGAGVLNDRRIADKTLAQFDAVFDTKVRGLRNLLDATAQDPLRLICLFSSVAARYGNIGQCDYAMANAVLNQVAWTEARRRDGDCLVKSINWGPWDGGMVSPSLKKHFHERGISLVPSALGAQLLVREIRTAGAGDVEVVIASTPAPCQVEMHGLPDSAAAGD